jgi:hypothetical protein
MPGTPVTVLGADNINPVGASNPLPIGQAGYSASASFTPAAASHTANDVVGAAAQFSLAAPAGSLLRIVNATMRVDGSTNETSTWRLHLYNVTPPSALADDAAFDLPSGDRASYLGYFDFAQLVDLGATLFIEATPAKVIKLSGTSVFGYLVNLTTLTPAAVARVITLHTVIAN